MASKKAVLVDPAVFDPAAVSQETHAFNQKLIGIAKGAPKWYEVGAETYREMRRTGKTPLPPATLLDSAEQSSIPSRDHASGRTIPVRIFRPTNGKKAHGVYMHIHGGGWVLQTEASQDPVMQDLANTNGLTLLSVGYRLAPEDPFPAGPNDCYDAAEWLVDNAEAKLGAPLKYVGGESAGGHLGMLTMLHLLQHKDSRYNTFGLKGLILHYGVYDLTHTPSCYTFDPPDTLVLDMDLLVHYMDVFLPSMSFQQRKDPHVSPFYANFEALRGKLPPALFTVGTSDCLLDDTVFMGTKYQMVGAKTEVLIVPGGCHGYCMFPRETSGAQADVAMKVVEDFITRHR